MCGVFIFIFSRIFLQFYGKLFHEWPYDKSVPQISSKHDEEVCLLSAGFFRVRHHDVIVIVIMIQSSLSRVLRQHYRELLLLPSYTLSTQSLAASL